MLLGMNLTINSILGMVALIGIVVNDSLVLVDFINRRKLAGDSMNEAVTRAGAARFRPIMLTSLTTFAGLLPLMFEQNVQAQFLIPMAVSLGFGVLFATLITLLLIPINYMVLDDFFRFSRKFSSEKIA
jgi:multidrug efflux pump subunit AcrB